MIFSASKHDALAGSRFGWGLVKDVELAKSMNDVNEAIVYTMPEDAVLRTYNTMSSILSKCTMEALVCCIHSIIVTVMYRGLVPE